MPPPNSQSSPRTGRRWPVHPAVFAPPILLMSSSRTVCGPRVKGAPSLRLVTAHPHPPRAHHHHRITLAPSPPAWGAPPMPVSLVPTQETGCHSSSQTTRVPLLPGAPGVDSPPWPRGFPLPEPPLPPWDPHCPQARSCPTASAMPCSLLRVLLPPRSPSPSVTGWRGVTLNPGPPAPALMPPCSCSDVLCGVYRPMASSSRGCPSSRISAHGGQIVDIVYKL